MTSLIIINVILILTICWIIVKSHITISDLREDLHDANVEITDKVVTIAGLEQRIRQCNESRSGLIRELDLFNLKYRRLQLALDEAEKMIDKLKKPTGNEE